MAFLDSMNISATALTAERMRMDVITQNMANSSTTRRADGQDGPYRRRFVVFQERQTGANSKFSEFLRERLPEQLRPIGSDITPNKGATRAGGVRVVEIGEDQSEFKYSYDPTHPDADEDGYVRLPNVEVVQEMVDMMAAYRAYEANITAINTFKDMAMKTLELGR